MHDTGLFVVTVASEKGGVGKTTIATNLAVYLKALFEELPVTIISFDNHFSVDNMFTIGSHHGRSVSAVFGATAIDQLVQLGEYGVQFMVSERQMHPPDDDVKHLSRVLARGALTGILIIDTRPILDYFTRNALLAADLVLAPVKDRPSLVNAGALQQALVDGGNDAERLWLVPSLIDGRTKLKEDVGIRDFILCSAVERGFQVVDTFIAKSPKVESLSTSFSSRIYPILTHARGTAVHKQMQELSQFVRRRYEATGKAGDKPLARILSAIEDQPPGRAGHLAADCPVCKNRVTGQDGYFYQELRHHKTGFVHSSCLDQTLNAVELQMLFPDRGGLLFYLAETGLTCEEGAVSLHLYDDEGEVIAVENIAVDESARLMHLFRMATGLEPGEMFREMILVALSPEAPLTFLDSDGANGFSRLRRLILEDLRENETL
ncbi:MAG: ParA family protein [Desulfuromonadales bacterium]|nr:ParA family protein [Desulfuromonadales bacterium]